MTTYEYDIDLSFDIQNLINNISISEYIIEELVSITTSGTTLSITFGNDLSEQGKADLDYLVENNGILINNPDQISSLNIVKTATTINIDLSICSCGAIIDGIHLRKRDMVLVKNQTDKKENGIYILNSEEQPERISLLDHRNAGNTIVIVNQGAVNANSIWMCDDEFGNDVVGIHDLNFTRIIRTSNTRNWNFNFPACVIPNEEELFEVVTFDRNTERKDFINSIEILLYVDTVVNVTSTNINLLVTLKGYDEEMTETVTYDMVGINENVITNTENRYYKLKYNFDPVIITEFINKLFLNLQYDTVNVDPLMKLKIKSVILTLK